MNDLVYFGTVARPHGIHGELKIDTDFNDRDGIAGIREMYYTDAEHLGRKLGIKKITAQQGFVLASFNEIPDRNEAEKYRRVMLYVNRDELSLPENISLVEDLVGSRILSMTDHRLMGTIKDVIHLPAHDVYLISTENGEGMVPALLKIFPRFDRDDKTIYADESLFLSCYSKNES